MEAEFRRIQEIPASLHKGAIERAVHAFIVETDTDSDPVGFYNQTLQRIAAAVIYKQPGVDFWLMHAYGEVAVYAIATIQVDIDGRLCYWVSQAWVSPEWRHDPVVKAGFEKMKAHAEDSLCAHFVIVTSRDPHAFCKFLGPKMRPYATIIKQELSAAIPKGVPNGLHTRSD